MNLPRGVGIVLPDKDGLDVDFGYSAQHLHTASSEANTVAYSKGHSILASKIGAAQFDFFYDLVQFVRGHVTDGVHSEFEVVHLGVPLCCLQCLYSHPSYTLQEVAAKKFSEKKVKKSSASLLYSCAAALY